MMIARSWRSFQCSSSTLPSDGAKFQCLILNIFICFYTYPLIDAHSPQLLFLHLQYACDTECRKTQKIPSSIVLYQSATLGTRPKPESRKCRFGLVRPPVEADRQSSGIFQPIFMGNCQHAILTRKHITWDHLHIFLANLELSNRNVQFSRQTSFENQVLCPRNYWRNASLNLAWCHARFSDITYVKLPCRN